MKVLIVGGKGRLGRGLAASAPADADIISLDVDTLDIMDCDGVAAIVAEVKPDWIFNAAAYTAVDKAESDEAAALAVNATAVAHLAAAAKTSGARFVHVSTDFAFDGLSGVPYAPDAAPNPLGVYGRTKLAGELAA